MVTESTVCWLIKATMAVERSSWLQVTFKASFRNLHKPFTLRRTIWIVLNVKCTPTAKKLHPAQTQNKYATILIILAWRCHKKKCNIHWTYCFLASKDRLKMYSTGTVWIACYNKTCDDSCILSSLKNLRCAKIIKNGASITHCSIICPCKRHPVLHHSEASCALLIHRIFLHISKYTKYKKKIPDLLDSETQNEVNIRSW